MIIIIKKKIKRIIMKVKSLNVLGVMTGTSFDGMDISIIKTNGN